MSGYSELIKKFDKIRDYMRDFYVYGFKSREDFDRKSARTYDNEKRRIESYMGDYMKWDYSGGSKTSFISVDCANIPVNPLYAAWKSKSFTNNDIMLHFYILDILKSGGLGIDELTNQICEQSERTFEVQTVRNKCKEYVEMGMLTQEKAGKAFIYHINTDNIICSDSLRDAVCFFQGAGSFGEVGNYIMDKEEIQNEVFSFKHHYIAHTLEDGVLLELLSAVRQNRTVVFEHQNSRSGKRLSQQGLPLKVFVSAGTGRRFVCMYSFRTRRFSNYRLDYIKKVSLEEQVPDAEELRIKLDRNLDKVWGVSFGGTSRLELLSMKLYIDEEREQYIIDRIEREGQGGKLERIGRNTFLYTVAVFDTADMSPWVKTFTGRIIQLEGTNTLMVGRFYNDLSRMARMYGLIAEEAGGGS